LGPPPAEGRGGGEIRYQADAQPLEVVLSGGIGLKDAKRYLIGQHVGASLLTGGLPATSYLWGVSGGEPFQSYSADNDRAFVTWIDFVTSLGSSLGFHFKEPAPSASVTCTAHLEVPQGALPAPGFDVSPFEKCGVEAPTSTLSLNTGAAALDPPNDPTSVHFVGYPFVQSGTIYSVGVLVDGKAITPPEFTSFGVGTWQFTQLITPGRRQINPQTGVTTVLRPHGQQVLDESFSYANAAPFDADNLRHNANDSPNQNLPGLPSNQVEIDDSFVVYLLYKPPGDDSAFVPLKCVGWGWQASVRRNDDDANKGWYLASIGSPPSLSQDYPDHPLWTARIDMNDYGPLTATPTPTPTPNP